MNHTIALEIFNSIVDGRDGTIPLTESVTLAPATGYFVGGAGSVLVFPNREDANRPTGLKLLTEFVAHATSKFVGWWEDSETGKVYVDQSDWFLTGGEAQNAAAVRGEIAFWDIEGGQEIRTS